MTTPRIKAKRLEIRRNPARRSQGLLRWCRRSEPIGTDRPSGRALHAGGLERIIEGGDYEAG